MEFRTQVQLSKPPFRIEPLEPLLFVGSCFADSIGRRFAEEHFPVTVNPFGVMYNPASVLHTIERTDAEARVVILTLGTNHVYRLKATGEIVDNCRKQPQSLFTEESLSVEASADFILQAVDRLTARRSDVQVVLTVSPIRYAKYGFHGSQLSKAVLLLAADTVVKARPNVTYFPAYEIVLDELRDYRFYEPDMIHPSQQAIEYIWQLFSELFFSDRALQFLRDWQPIKNALRHRPFHPDSEDYQLFLAKARQDEQQLLAEYA